MKIAAAHIFVEPQVGRGFIRFGYEQPSIAAIIAQSQSDFEQRQHNNGDGDEDDCKYAFFSRGEV